MPEAEEDERRNEQEDERRRHTGPLGSTWNVRFRFSLRARHTEVDVSIVLPCVYDGERYGVRRVVYAVVGKAKGSIASQDPRWRLSVVATRPNMLRRSGLQALHPFPLAFATKDDASLH